MFLKLKLFKLKSTKLLCYKICNISRGNLIKIYAGILRINNNKILIALVYVWKTLLQFIIL